MTHTHTSRAQQKAPSNAGKYTIDTLQTKPEHNTEYIRQASDTTICPSGGIREVGTGGHALHGRGHRVSRNTIKTGTGEGCGSPTHRTIKPVDNRLMRGQ